MVSEYMMGYKNEPVKKIILQGYHLVLQKSENLKDHPIDFNTGISIVVDIITIFIDILIMKMFLSLFLHSWLFFHPSEHN